MTTLWRTLAASSRTTWFGSGSKSYVAYRWTPREVVWTVAGPGEFHVPLYPAEIDGVEVWDSGEFVETLDVLPAPCGFFLPACGPYRFTATVGGGSPEPELPWAVAEAVRRLGAYMKASAASTGEPGARSYTVDLGGDISETINRNEAWTARAMANSGAGDLLRPYRRAP